MIHSRTSQQAARNALAAGFMDVARMTFKRALFGFQAALLRTTALSMMLALSACAASAVNIVDPTSHHVIDIPFFKQQAHQCGPAAMASVLNYRGVAITPEEIAAAIYSPGAAGTLDIDMVLYAQKLGRKAEKYRGSLEDLQKNVDLKNPLIVLVDYGFLAYQRNHFMVVRGYDENHIYVNSGLEPLAAISKSDFLHGWEKTNFWALLIQ